MMAIELEFIRVGSIRRTPVGDLADIAARRLLTLTVPTEYAVTLEPGGIVMIEPLDEAIPEDLVGVYDPETLEGEGALISLKLFRQIREDLKHAVERLETAA